MIPREPNCPHGYVDQTNGAAYWWDCGHKCPGPWPWATSTCACACVTPEEYEIVMAERASREAAGSLASSSSDESSAPSTAGAATRASGGAAPAAGTFVAPPATTSSNTVKSDPSSSSGSLRQRDASPERSPLHSTASLGDGRGASPAQLAGAAPVSLGPAIGARPPNLVGQSITEAPMQAAVWIAPSETGSAQDKDAADSRLSTLSLIGISIGSTLLLSCCILVLICCWGYVRVHYAPRDIQVEKQTFLVKMWMRFTSPLASILFSSDLPYNLRRQKPSRVAPMPQEDVNAVVVFSRPRRHRFQEQQIQPMARIKDFTCPDVSIISRQQKERVLWNGWTAGPNSAATAHKIRTPSVSSDASTRSPSVHPSSGSAGSKPPTPPNLDV